MENLNINSSNLIPFADFPVLFRDRRRYGDRDTESKLRLQSTVNQSTENLSRLQALGAVVHSTVSDYLPRYVHVGW